MSDLDAAIVGAVQGVTKKWTKQRKAEERLRRAYVNRRHVFTVRETTIKDAAYQVMEEAYNKASGNGRYPANARQIMYAARPYIQEITDKPLNDAYFTQRLLPDYIEESGVGWDVVWDARGSLDEPHTDFDVPLGTIDVRNYVGSFKSGRDEAIEALDRIATSFPTKGPANRFGAALFIEKEGFEQLLEAATIAERYDVAIMSTKGMSVTASRYLIEHLGVPIYVLHDFDQAGFAILGTLQRSTRRYRFWGHVEVHDLGLTLADIDTYGLMAEDQMLTHSRTALYRNGASSADVAFLAANQRVELNMLTSEQLVELIETKFDHHGVEKVIPSDDVLEIAYRRAVEVHHLNEALDKAAEEAHEKATKATVPADLRKTIEDHLKEHREEPWDEAIAALFVSDDNDEEDPRGQ